MIEMSLVHVPPQMWWHGVPHARAGNRITSVVCAWNKIYSRQSCHVYIQHCTVEFLFVFRPVCIVYLLHNSAWRLLLFHTVSLFIHGLYFVGLVKLLSRRTVYHTGCSVNYHCVLKVTDIMNIDTMYKIFLVETCLCGQWWMQDQRMNVW